jgi:2-polyprenyl-3-methyl-5-hydroxy-6-metoxy-1,4-benzoquinol methylase
MQNKFKKLVNDPFGILHRRIIAAIERLRYARGDGYRSESYWAKRHGKFQFDPRGVGDLHLTIEENLEQLHTGGRLLLELCREEKVDFPSARILDVGCGTGYYAQLFQQQGCSHYVGIDIVDTLFHGLRLRLPTYEFKVADISRIPLTGTYDLIIMMDVAQHITERERFQFAMENLKAHLSPGGVIIISTIIGENRRLGFYVVERARSEFENIFQGFRISQPVPFITNEIFSIRKK